jgi:hypothetical protein
MNTEGCEKKRNLNILIYFPGVILDNLETAIKSEIRMSDFPETSGISSRSKNKYAASFC